MRFDIITIFPQFFEGFLTHGIIRRARERAQADIAVHDLRDYAVGRHRVVDDRPFGGEDGMALKPEPLFRAIEAITHPTRCVPIAERNASDAADASSVAVIVLTPQGRRFTQAEAARLSEKAQVVLICGRYEGVDERVALYAATDELSIGDYVLSGGEVAAMVVVDAVTRLLPGVLGSPTSAANESFTTGRLDYPVYTRPATYRGHAAPPVLLTGHHAEVETWRRRAALEKTLRYRPDLLADAERLDARDREILAELEREARSERK
jgi:tRNA (guanine37-N1)-methyltransferase